MPLLNQSSVGSFSVTSPVLTKADTVTQYTTAFDTKELFVDQLPKLVFWAQQISGTNPITITPQFAIRAEDGITAPVLDWLDLSAPVLLPAGSPLILNFEIPAQFIRLRFDAPNATQDVKYVISAYAS